MTDRHTFKTGLLAVDINVEEAVNQNYEVLITIMITMIVKMVVFMMIMMMLVIAMRVFMIVMRAVTPTTFGDGNGSNRGCRAG